MVEERDLVTASRGDVRLQSDNQSEIRVGRLPIAPIQVGKGTSPLDVDTDLLTLEAELRSPKFSGAEEDNKTINWFGGSYSGADMKVVAHLYQATTNDEEMGRIQNDLDVAERIKDGANALVVGGIAHFAYGLTPATDYQTKKDTFLTAAGLSLAGNPVDDEAAKFLIQNIFIGANWSTPLGRGKAKIRAERVRGSQEFLATAIREVLKTRKDLADKGQQTVVLASLQTLSVQSHREKFAVRALGHSYVKGYTRGPRTIAGSMIFTVFNEHALASLTRSLGKSSTYGEKDVSLHTLLPDQLPPLDLTIAFANEYGSISSLRLMGVEFINDGATYSIEDLMTENVINFVARDADPMTSHDNIKLHRNQTGLADEYKDLSGSQLLLDDPDYEEYLGRLGLRRRLMHR